jgi:UDP-N-acetyl-D-glucosamine dehydrogenase
VGSWQGKESAPLTGADMAIVVTKHDEVSETEIMSAAPYVFDTTGRVKRAVQL